MPTNIEELITKVDVAKTQIEEYKTLSTSEQVQKTKDLESIVSQIKIDLDSLRVSATPKELVQIEALDIQYLALKSNLQDQLNSLKKEVAVS
jgi:hypothetical protein